MASSNRRSKRPTPPQRPRTPRPAAPPPPPATRKPSTALIGGVIAAIVVAAALVAIVVSRGGDDDNGDSATDLTSNATCAEQTTSGSTTVPAAGSGSAAENQPVTVAGEALPSHPSSGTDNGIGLTPPALSGSSFDGSPITVDPCATTGATMVVFVAHWCPHCNVEVPRLVEWYESGAVPDGLQVVAVSTGVESNADNYPPSQWITDNNWPWPVLADDAEQTAAQAWGLDAYPYFVIINSDGVVTARDTGEKSIEDITALVDAALA